MFKQKRTQAGAADSAPDDLVQRHCLYVMLLFARLAQAQIPTDFQL